MTVHGECGFVGIGEPHLDGEFPRFEFGAGIETEGRWCVPDGFRAENFGRRRRVELGLDAVSDEVIVGKHLEKWLEEALNKEAAHDFVSCAGLDDRAACSRVTRALKRRFQYLLWNADGRRNRLVLR